MVADALSRRSDHEEPSAESTLSAATTPVSHLQQSNETAEAAESAAVSVHLNALGITSISAESLLNEIRSATTADNECQTMAADPQVSYTNGLLYGVAI